MQGFDMSQLTVLGLALAGISFGIIAIMMLGGALWQDRVQQYKRLINDVIIGAVLLLVASGLITAIASSLQ